MTVMLRPTTARNELARDPKTAPEVPAYSMWLRGSYFGVCSSPAFPGDRAAEALRLAKNHATYGREAEYVWSTGPDGVVYGAERLVDDRRYRLLLVRGWADGNAIEADPIDSDAARYMVAGVEAVAADYGVDPDHVWDRIAGTLPTMARRTGCVGCGDLDYVPTCPSCRIDAGVTLG